MYKPEVLGIVPARGGSKSIAHKNIVPLCGRPLLSYTIEAARTSSLLSRCVLSSDDEEISDVARQLGLEVPFMRPAELASDEAPTLPVLQHVLETLDQNEGYRPEVVVLLQPTSPLRSAAHIDACIRLLLDGDADSVLSVQRVPHPFNPLSVMRLQDGYMLPFAAGEGTRLLRKQDKPAVYARNGAVYAMRRETLMVQHSLFGAHSQAYVMSERDSLDIDSPDDLWLAEAVMEKMARETRD